MKIPLLTQQNQATLLTLKWQAMNINQQQKVVAQEDVKRVETPDCKSIDDVAAFLKVDEEQTIKHFSSLLIMNQ